MVVVIDLDLCNFENVDTIRFIPNLFFIFQGSQENLSKILNYFRNIFPTAEFGEPIIRHYAWTHILICNKLQ